MSVVLEELHGDGAAAGVKKATLQGIHLHFACQGRGIFCLDKVR